MTDIYLTLAGRLRQARQKLGWTQEELAEKAELHPSYIGQIERGEKKVSLATVDRLSRALSLKPGVLLDDSLPQLTSGWESRIGGLLRDKNPSEKEILYNTLRQLSQDIRKIRKLRSTRKK